MGTNQQGIALTYRPAVTQATVMRLVLAGVFTTAGLYVAAMIGAATFNDAALTRWLFAWQDGIAKRALVGTIGRMLAGDTGPTQADLVAVGQVVRALTVVAAAGVAGHLCVDRTGRLVPVRVVVAGAALLSGPGIGGLAGGIGRLDQLVILLAIGAGIATVRRRPAVSGILLGVATLVHEAALAWVGVWLAAYVWRATGRRKDLVWLLAPAVAVAAVVTLYSPATTPETVVASLEARTDVAVDTEVLGFEFVGVRDNVEFTWGWITGEGRERAAGSLLAAVPLAVLCLVALRGVRLSRADRPLLWACAGPLLMMPIAVDWGRWVSFSTLLLTVTTLMLARGGRMLLVAAAAVLVLAGTVVFGPIGAHAYLPW